MPIEHIDLSGRASDYPEALSTSARDTPEDAPPAPAPNWRILLYPHRSLPRRGFAIFIAITSALFVVPLLPLIGTAALWLLLPFLVATVAAMWFFLMRNYKDAELVEELSLWPERLTLIRRDPKGQTRHWEANPYWVSAHLHDTPVPSYLTLRGGPREVELGAFLSPVERLEVKDLLEEELRVMRQRQN